MNYGIKIRDQVKFPIAADGKTVMSELGEEGQAHFSLHFDFSNKKMPHGRGGLG